MLKELIINQPLQILWINALNILRQSRTHTESFAHPLSELIAGINCDDERDFILQAASSFNPAASLVRVDHSCPEQWLERPHIKLAIQNLAQPTHVSLESTHQPSSTNTESQRIIRDFVPFTQNENHKFLDIPTGREEDDKGYPALRLCHDTFPSEAHRKYILVALPHQRTFIPIKIDLSEETLTYFHQTELDAFAEFENTQKKEMPAEKPLYRNLTSFLDGFRSERKITVKHQAIAQENLRRFQAIDALRQLISSEEVTIKEATKAETDLTEAQRTRLEELASAKPTDAEITQFQENLRESNGLLIMPLCNYSHWSAIAIDCTEDKKTIYTFDSMSPNKKLEKVYVNKLKSLIGDADYSKYTWCNNKTRYQFDGVSCGLFVTAFCQFIHEKYREINQANGYDEQFQAFLQEKSQITADDYKRSPKAGQKLSKKYLPQLLKNNLTTLIMDLLPESTNYNFYQIAHQQSTKARAHRLKLFDIISLLLVCTAMFYLSWSSRILLACTYLFCYGIAKQFYPNSVSNPITHEVMTLKPYSLDLESKTFVSDRKPPPGKGFSREEKHEEKPDFEMSDSTLNLHFEEDDSLEINKAHKTIN